MLDGNVPIAEFILIFLGRKRLYEYHNNIFQAFTFQDLMLLNKIYLFIFLTMPCVRQQIWNAFKESSGNRNISDTQVFNM